MVNGKQGARGRWRRFVAQLLSAGVMTASALAVAQQAPPPPPHQTGLVFASPQQLLGVPLASMPFSGAQLPSSVDLSNDLPPPGDQGHQSSCVGWAVAYALKSQQEKVEEHWPLTIPNSGIHPEHVFSPAYIYNQINGGRDSGAQFVDAFRVLTSQGAAPLSAMLYNEADFLTQPSAVARQVAGNYRIAEWRQVNVRDVIELKAQLNAGLPVVIGAVVDDGFLRLPAGAVWKGRDRARS